ncbi:MAG: carboxypeptidase-like regulatory domain-containing protein [Saprospiraceae bacterium]
MRTTIQSISIPKPCHEDWNAMRPNEKGRFCDSCQKTVHDFSSMSDEELIAFFEKKQGSLCGRIDSKKLDRINRKIYLQSPSFGKEWFTAFFFSGFLSLLGNASLFGQKSCDKSDGKIEIISDVAQKPDSVTFIIEGKVVEAETGEPLIFGNVYFSNNLGGTTTDLDGNFRLIGNSDSTSIVTENVFIEVSYVGYKTFIAKADSLLGKRVSITMPADSYVLGEYVVLKRPFHQRVWIWFKNLF